jgi:hypothetical protein
MIAPPLKREPNPEVEQIQPIVQRRLGRVLICIQQYEGLLKALISESEVAGTTDSFESNLNARRERLRTQSLGLLVKQLSASILRTVPIPDSHDAPHSTALPVFRMRFGIQLDEAQLAQVEQDLRQLVDLRNRLVHHLLDEFDVFSVAGCEAALVHLEEGYRTVDAAYVQLAGWAQQAAHARKAVAELLNTPEFRRQLLGHDNLPSHQPTTGTPPDAN